MNEKKDFVKLSVNKLSLCSTRVVTFEISILLDLKIYFSPEIIISDSSEARGEIIIILFHLFFSGELAMISRRPRHWLASSITETFFREKPFVFDFLFSSARRICSLWKWSFHRRDDIVPKERQTNRELSMCVPCASRARARDSSVPAWAFQSHAALSRACK